MSKFWPQQACIAGIPVRGKQKTAAGEGEGLKNMEGKGGPPPPPPPQFFARLEREHLQCRLPRHRIGGVSGYTLHTFKIYLKIIHFGGTVLL